MKETRITSASVGDEELKQLYQTAFPENEQIPWDDITKELKQHWNWEDKR